MFSFFVASFLIGALSYVFVFFKLPNILFSQSLTTISVFVSVFVVNYICFLPKRRQLKHFEEYKNNQSGMKDTFAIIFSILSVGIFFSVILLGKEYFGS